MSSTVFRLVSVVITFGIAVALSMITQVSLVTVLAVFGFLMAVDLKSQLTFTELVLRQEYAKSEKKDD